MKKIMAALFLICLLAAPAAANTASTKPQGYLIGGIVALLIMVYLIYSLIRPEKF
jgi:K+-transporting ATPase KdpF subunit